MLDFMPSRYKKVREYEVVDNASATGRQETSHPRSVHEKQRMQDLRPIARRIVREHRLVQRLDALCRKPCRSAGKMALPEISLFVTEHLLR